MMVYYEIWEYQKYVTRQDYIRWHTIILDCMWLYEIRYDNVWTYTKHTIICGNMLWTNTGHCMMITSHMM